MAWPLVSPGRADSCRVGTGVGQEPLPGHAIPSMKMKHGFASESEDRCEQKRARLLRCRTCPPRRRVAPRTGCRSAPRMTASGRTFSVQQGSGPRHATVPAALPAPQRRFQRRCRHSRPANFCWTRILLLSLALPAIAQPRSKNGDETAFTETSADSAACHPEEEEDWCRCCCRHPSWLG